MKTLGVIANCTKPRAGAVLERLARCARQAGLELLADEDTARLFAPSCAAGPHELFDRAEAVMALGGDGTMLRVARESGLRDRPLIGVNIGALGFLTSVAEEDLDRAVDCLARDDYTVSARTMAACTILRGGVPAASYRALNEVLVARRASSRAVLLDVAVDGDEVTSYLCDGLVVSTPTGSTGYALSAGGPILLPRTRAFVLGVICPHTLNSRALVLPDSSEIVISTAEADEDLLVAVDGQQGEALQRGDAVRVTRFDRPLRFIHLPGYSYFRVLRQKLHWRGCNV